MLLMLVQYNLLSKQFKTSINFFPITNINPIYYHNETVKFQLTWQNQPSNRDLRESFVFLFSPISITINPFMHDATPFSIICSHRVVNFRETGSIQRKDASRRARVYSFYADDDWGRGRQTRSERGRERERRKNWRLTSPRVESP